jgi:hypothetical protein
MGDIVASVAAALEASTSQNPLVMKPAADLLQKWETQPGFFSVLLSLFLGDQLGEETRLMAVLLFKNGIDKYWRRGADKCVLHAHVCVYAHECVCVCVCVCVFVC